MTIPKLEVSLNGIFEYGQGYVALSRATCLDGLTVHNFEPTRIKAHPRVKEFYQSMSLQNSSALPSRPQSDSRLVNLTLQELMDVYKQSPLQVRHQLQAGEDEEGWMDTKVKSSSSSGISKFSFSFST